MGESQAVTWEEVEGLRLSSVGYRASDDPCRRAGETPLTSNWLDHTADLVACPIGDPSIADLRNRFGAREVAQTGSYTLYSIPKPERS